MRCGFQMVVRIPYPATIPKYFAVASEVATMDLLRSFGLPMPKVYRYLPTPDNAAGTEYILLEFVQGTNLSYIRFDLEEEEIISISRQLAQFESKMMSITFPAGGSLYYTADLESAAGSASWLTRPGITLEDKRFCVGPDTSLRLWYGRRSQLDLDRGPCRPLPAFFYCSLKLTDNYRRKCPSSPRKRGRKLTSLFTAVRWTAVPFQRVRREGYKYQEQPPSDHIENLDRYFLIASSLIPRNPALGHFRIRHPDLQPSNIIVSTSPDSNLQVVGLIDWQHTSILPLFLLTGIPQQLQNYADIGSQSMASPSLPEKLDDLDETQKSKEMELYRCRLVHNHYVKNTEECNELHYAALTDPVGVLRRRLFCHASDLWEGETLALKVALIQATKDWKTLTEGGPPCPVVFDPNDVYETMKLDAEQKEADESLEACRDVIGFGRRAGCPPSTTRRLWHAARS